MYSKSFKMSCCALWCREEKRRTKRQQQSYKFTPINTWHPMRMQNVSLIIIMAPGCHHLIHRRFRNIWVRHKTKSDAEYKIWSLFLITGVTMLLYGQQTQRVWRPQLFPTQWKAVWNHRGSVRNQTSTCWGGRLRWENASSSQTNYPTLEEKSKPAF